VVLSLQRSISSVHSFVVHVLLNSGLSVKSFVFTLTRLTVGLQTNSHKIANCMYFC